MSHLPVLIPDLALILGVAAIVTLIFKKLNQPVVLGYIVAGFLVGPNFHLVPTILEIDNIKIWADIGVLFLLFSLGLEFNFKKMLRVGGVAGLTAFIEVSLTMATGYLVGRLLGWTFINSLFLGGILAIASTTIIIRSFDELGVKSQKFAGVVTGVLVIEDLVAVLLMVLLSTVAVSNSFSGADMLFSLFKLAFFLVLWFITGIYFIPTFLRKIRKQLNEESLLVLSLALCFLMVILATYVGFSAPLGAFIMGSVLGETLYAGKIDHILTPLKNLFGAIFFVSVGMLIDPGMLGKYAVSILVLSLVLLIGKPLFVTMGVLIAGQPLKIAIPTGMSLSQIGEFSFIIASLGLSLKVTGDFLYPVAVAVSVLTTFTTPYMIRLSNPLTSFIERILPGKLKRLLDDYSAEADKVTVRSSWSVVLRSYFINIIIFSILLIAIIILSTEYLVPLFAHYKMHDIISTIVTLGTMSPFLWALAFRRSEPLAYADLWVNASLRKPLILLEISRLILAVLFIGFLFHRLFSPTVALIGATVTCLILLASFNRLKAFYNRIESRFMANLNQHEHREEASRTMLTPWDTHIATIELNEKAPFIGSTLATTQLRERFGINIVKIDRGNSVINTPGRDERLYPQDKLYIIGTDEQLNAFNAYLESSSARIGEGQIRPEISLFHLVIPDNSPLVGKSIRESRIRELSQGIIVGIEREGSRIINPDSVTEFMPYDIVYIVGNKMRIQVLMRDLL